MFYQSHVKRLALNNTTSLYSNIKVPKGPKLMIQRLGCVRLCLWSTVRISSNIQYVYYIICNMYLSHFVPKCSTVSSPWSPLIYAMGKVCDSSVLWKLVLFFTFFALKLFFSYGSFFRFFNDSLNDQLGKAARPIIHCTFLSWKIGMAAWQQQSRTECNSLVNLCESYNVFKIFI